MVKQAGSRRVMPRVIVRILVSGIATVLLVGIAPVALAVDYSVEPASRSVELKKDDDGTPAGTMQVSAPGSSDLTLTFGKDVPVRGCVPKETTVTVVAHSRKEIALAFPGCELDTPAYTRVHVTSKGETPGATETFDLTLVLSDAKPYGWRLVWILLVSLGVSGLLASTTYMVRYQGWVKTYQPAQKKLWARVKSWFANTSSGNDVVADEQTPEPPGGVRLPELRDAMAEAKEGWSFKDSYLANITIVVTALTAVGTADFLSALWGDIDAAEKSTLLVGIAASTFLVGLSTFLIRAIGSTGEVTVGGLFAGMFVTVAGAGVLVGTIEEALRRGSVGPDFLWVFGGAGLAVLILRYPFAAVDGRMQKAFPAVQPTPEKSDTAKAADSIGSAIATAANTIVTGYPIPEEAFTSPGDDSLPADVPPALQASLMEFLADRNALSLTTSSGDTGRSAQI